MAKVYIGVDLGGTNIKIGCFDPDLNLIANASIPTDVDKGAQDIVYRIGDTVEKMLADNGLSADDISAAGIGSPGVIDTANGIVIQAANMGFKNTPLRQMLSDRLGKPVVLENDANVTAWGEYAAGAGKGTKNMILIALGTGVGGGIIVDGELLHGFENKGGEIGHMIVQPNGRQCGCTQKGCIEAYSSASSTAARATEAIQAGGESSLKQLLENNGKITCKDVFDHVAAGDKLAKKITDATAEYLAILCVSLLHLTGPEKILFFGGMIGAGDLLLNPVKEHFNKQMWTIQKEDIELCFATLGADAGIVGNAALAMHAQKQGKI